ncbi:MAG: VanZ family protein [Prevotella sp.]|nr:VanZ family protein [Candidatus Prevotella equi]
MIPVFTAILTLAIWIVCLIPVPETPLDNVAFIDKWTHFVMYGTLTIVTWTEYFYHHRQGKTLPPVSIGMIRGFVWPIIMGGLIELAQHYLTTCRSGDWLDFLCNSIGVVLGFAIVMVGKRIYQKTIT